jgi:hypothetical protein
LLPAPLEQVAIEGFEARHGGTSATHRESATDAGQAIHKRRPRNRSRRTGFHHSRGFTQRNAHHRRAEDSV